MQENIICINTVDPLHGKGRFFDLLIICAPAQYSLALKVALTVAGSDSGGGAGIQSDLKTFSAFGIFGCSVVTAITSQNTFELRDVFPIPPKIISNQLKSILSDFKSSRSKNWNAI